MKKSLSFITTRNTVPAVLGAVGAVLLVALVAWASTTIGDNISTAGTITVTGTSASTFPVASTTSLDIANVVTVDGAGTSTYTGGITTGGISSSEGLNISLGDALFSGLIKELSSGTSTFTGGVSFGGITTTKGLSVSSGSVGVGTTTSNAGLVVGGGSALFGGPATSTVSISSTATKTGCIQLQDSNGSWIRMYPGGGAGTAGRTTSFVASSSGNGAAGATNGIGLLVIEQGQCTP